MDAFTLIVVLLTIIWATGNFLFPVGSFIHILLVLILIIVVVRLMQSRPLP